MGARCWKPRGPLLLVLPNVTALLLLAGTFLMLNWPPVSIRSTAVRMSRGGEQVEQLEKSRDCSRPCLDGEKARECHFKFVLETVPTVDRGCSKCPANETECVERHCVLGDGVQRIMLSVNRKLPGTAVQVCEGDTVVVDVESHLPGLETALHWYGQLQRGTPYMDGVPMITQCPIQSETNFRYKFRASNPGTHFYHSHYVSHHADGIFGPFIVRQTPRLDPNSDLYDYDLEEHIVTISAWSRYAFVYNLDLPENMHLSSILINGKGTYFNPDSKPGSQMPKTRFAVKRGGRYRFRVINAAPLDCPVQLQVEGHRLMIIASDGAPVKSTDASHLLLFPGERYDIVLNADQPSSSYWIMVRGHDQCKNLHQEALLVYDGATLPHKLNDITKSSLSELSAAMVKLCPSLSYPTCRPQEIKSLQTADTQNNLAKLQVPQADMKLFIPFDVYAYDGFTDADVNFGFSLKESLYSPSYLYNRNTPVQLSQVDRLTFRYPSSPLLSQPEFILREMLCDEQCRNRKFCECLHIVRVPLNVALDIVLIDEGYGSNHSNTFHLHGYNFLVLGSESLGHPVDVAEIKQIDSHGLLSRNLVDAPRKDTVVVPNKGYTIIRLFTDNPGYWLFEVRSESSIIGGGLQFIVQVGEQNHLPPVPPDFPHCGTHKWPNFVF